MAERKRDPRVEKARRIAAERGMPARCYPHEFEALRAHLKKLHDAGMTCYQMEYESGVVEASTIMAFLTGKRKGIQRGEEDVKGVRRSTYDALMRVQYVAPDGLGSKVDPTSTRRRLQAFCAMGYTTTWVAEQLGQRKAYVNKVTMGQKGVAYVYWSNREAVKALFEKYEHVKPEDVGLTAYAIGRAKGNAARHGYAPGICWDDDTIGDPDAHAEWTGKCGSVTGYYLHLKHEIGIERWRDAGAGRVRKAVRCQPCIDARIATRRERANRGDGYSTGRRAATLQAIWDYQEAHPDASAEEVAERLHISARTVVRARAEQREALGDGDD